VNYVHVHVYCACAPPANLSPLPSLQVYVPTFSVTALLGVTAYVTVGAVHDILYKPEDDDVNIYVMYGFAAANTVVDIISVYMFYRMGEAAFFQDKHALTRDEQQQGEASASASGGNYSVEEGAGRGRGDEDVVGEQAAAPRSVVVGVEKNLNMISAFTHVGGDSLRTVSIFVAAIVANVKLGAPYLCDAWAAVIVTVTIVIMVIPLINEIFKAYRIITSKMDTVAMAAAGLDSPDAAIM